MKSLLIGLDFDKTIAFHDPDKPKPIKDMDVIPVLKKKVLNWIEQGHKVYLFTARATDEAEIAKLRTWLDVNDLQGIKKITNEKIPGTDYYVDDMVLPVEANTGKMECDPITRDVESEIKAARKSGRY